MSSGSEPVERRPPSAAESLAVLSRTLTATVKSLTNEARDSDAQSRTLTTTVKSLTNEARGSDAQSRTLSTTVKSLTNKARGSEASEPNAENASKITGTVSARL